MREVPESGSAARRIRMVVDSNVIETWDPVLGLNAADWERQVDGIRDALTEELPKRRVSCVYTAEDNAGAVISQHVTNITGKNANAQDLGTQNGAKALSDALASVAKTVDAVLAQARNMMDFQAAQLERKDEQIFEYAELFRAIQKLELEQGETENAVSKMLLTQIEGAAPIALQALQHYMEKSHATKMAAAAAAATKTNGHAS
jgi:hypothetical protein